MPRQKLTAEQIQDDAEKLFLEHAQAFYRDLRQAAQHAPRGKIIERADAFVFQQGREFLRNTLEKIVQEQNDLLEKKRNSDNAPADENAGTSDTGLTKP